MTIRMIGALFLTLSGACYALERNRGQSQRLKLLRNLSDALYYIEWELKTNLTPLDELIQTLSGERSAGNAKVFFKNLGERLNRQGMVTFPQCWCAEVRVLKDSLTGEEQDALLTLGDVLGRYGVEEMCCAMDRCIQVLERGYESTRCQAKERSRLSWGLGLAAGGTLAIVLF